MFDFKNDKSWFVILVLLFAFLPFGIMALIAKIIYTIYKTQNNVDDTFTKSTKDYRSRASNWSAENSASDLHEIENELKDNFDSWKEASVVTQSNEDFDYSKSDGYDHKGFPVDLSGDEARTLDVTLEAAGPLPVEISLPEHLGRDAHTAEVEVPKDYLAIDHLEVELNETIDLTFTDVHIDTEITFDDEPEDHDHEGEVPLKVITCRMCDTENRIYKIDVFETPTCEKCGMLLLDRS